MWASDNEIRLFKGCIRNSLSLCYLVFDSPLLKRRFNVKRCRTLGTRKVVLAGELSLPEAFTRKNFSHLLG